MALLALGTPANYLTDYAFTGTSKILPATETAPTGNTGCTFVNSPEGLVILRVVVGASGAGNATVVGQNGASNKVVAVANSDIYLLGPFDPALYSNSSGLVQVNFSVVTGNSVGVYILPDNTNVLTGLRGLHNPFEMTAGAADR